MAGADELAGAGGYPEEFGRCSSVSLSAVVMFFGGSKLPQLARGLGSAASKFRKGITEGDTGTPNEESPEESRGAPRPTDAPGPAAGTAAGEDVPAGGDDCATRAVDD